MITTKKLYYLASPYTHTDPIVKKQRAEAVTKSAVDLLHKGVFVFAPISYNEPWEKYNLPGDWHFWSEFDKTFVSRCDGGLIVLMLDGWEKSVGVTAEIEFARSIGLPVYYTTPEQISNGDLSFLNNKTSDRESVPLFCSGQKF
jgi:nucleoside 2-deoxyribosyltransferase